MQTDNTQKLQEEWELALKWMLPGLLISYIAFVLLNLIPQGLATDRAVVKSIGAAAATCALFAMFRYSFFHYKLYIKDQKEE